MAADVKGELNHDVSVVLGVYRTTSSPIPRTQAVEERNMLAFILALGLPRRVTKRPPSYCVDI